jgi:V-type H+-transporting ATPase subunit E
MAREVKGEKVYKTKLTLVDGDFSSLAPGGDCGGVILTSLDRRIVCNNTLQSRLDLCFEELLPQIRGILFPPVPEPEPPRQSEAERKSHAA